jgi:hypothetical protein
MRILGQFVFYAMFATVVGLFSVWPEVRLFADDKAVVSVSFSHVGKRIVECRVPTPEEINALMADLSKKTDCPRGRHPIRVEIRTDNDILYSATISASGLSSDGAAVVYQRIKVAVGEHRLQVSLSESGAQSGYDWIHTELVNLKSGQNLVIGFDDLSQTFTFE